MVSSVMVDVAILVLVVTFADGSNDDRKGNRINDDDWFQDSCKNSSWQLLIVKDVSLFLDTVAVAMFPGIGEE